MASIFIDLPASTVSIPTGASTELKQDAEIVELQSLVAKDFSTEFTLAAVKTAVEAIQAVDFATQTTLAALLVELQLKADLLETQPVSIASAVTVNAGTNLNTSALNLEATQALIKAKTDNIPALGQALAASSVPVVLTAAQITTLTPPAAITGFALDTSIDALRILNGAVTETAPATDTASSGLNGRLQRIAQNISAMILQLPATLGIKTAAASLSIAPASDAIFNTKDKALTGSYAENLALTTVSTFTAPANAIGAIVQADDTNAANFRAKQGAVATASSGVQFQAGRSEKFDSGTDISVCSEGASVKVYVQWFIQA